MRIRWHRLPRAMLGFAVICALGPYYVVKHAVGFAWVYLTYWIEEWIVQWAGQPELGRA